MAFDKDKPASTTSLRASNPEMLANQSQLQDAVNNEHIFTGTAAGTQTGDHTQGSARCFSQATAPTTRIDGTTFLSTDLGSLWVDTDDNAIYVLTATTPTWTPVSTEVIATLLASGRVFGDSLGVTGDFAVNTDKMTVAAATGNTLVAGTFDVGSSTAISSILDEDDMTSDLATALATQQSIKAYIDTKTIVNIEQAVKTSVQTIATAGDNTTYTDVTSLSVSITPSSTDSKIRVSVTLNGSVGGAAPMAVRLIRDTTALNIGDQSGSDKGCATAMIATSTARYHDTCTIEYIDSPASTSATTYKVACNVNGNDGYINRSQDWGDDQYQYSTASSIIVEEILQ